MLVLMGIYLGLVSLAELPAHAFDLFWQDKVFVIPIMLGFGIQVALYTFLKITVYRPLPAPMGGATTAAGGGLSTAAMLACCAHHVTDVLPLVGLTAAATFLANWKIPFMVVGLLTNLVGILVMLRLILKERERITAQLASVEAS
jgi:hypothetical protein